MPYGIVAGAVIGAVASNSAANTQADAANNATNASNAQYNQTRDDQAQYRTAGYTALSKMQDLLGLSDNTSAAGYGSLNTPFTGTSVATDPGYQFGLTQGLNSAQNSAAAKGGLYSGATLKALTQYGNDYATTKFDDAYNRDQQNKTAVYNRLAGVSGTGQTATNQVDAAGATNAAQVSSNLIGAGNARGAADIATGNSIGNGVNQAAAWWQRTGTNSTPYTPTGSPYAGADDPYPTDASGELVFD